MLSTTLRPLYDLLRSAAWSFNMPVHFSTRCLVSVREPSCESIKIVSFATKKVNEWPVVASLAASIIVGWPPESTNFPSEAVYSACSEVPTRSPWRTVTPPRASARWSCCPAAGPRAAVEAAPGCAAGCVEVPCEAFPGDEDSLDDEGSKNTSRVRECIDPCCESAVTPPCKWAFPASPQYVSRGA